MSQRQTKVFCLIIVLVPVFFLRCGGGPQGPAKGSPGWLYQAAQESFLAGDWEKTHQHLEKIESSGHNPYLDRALALHLVLETGLLFGDQELAEAYQKGWDHAGPRKPDFMTGKMNYLKEARRHAIHLAETYDRFVKGVSEKPVVLEFPFPRGSGAPVAELERVYNGMSLSEEQRTALQDNVMNRGMVRGVSAVISSSDDSAGAQKNLQNGRAQVPAPKFVLAMGERMWKTAPIFERRNLSEPDKVKFLHDRVLDAASRARQLKPDAAVEAAAKKLQEDCERAMKARKA